jgi:hypothetical protein
MAEPTESTTTTETNEPRQKNIVERLADVGEGAIQRLGSAPGGDKVVSTFGGMRDRLDELQRRVRGLEDMEKRVAGLEERVDRLEGKRPSATTAAETSSAVKPKQDDTTSAL